MKASAGRYFNPFPCTTPNLYRRLASTRKINGLAKAAGGIFNEILIPDPAFLRLF
jgi:hypothetical protein